MNKLDNWRAKENAHHTCYRDSQQWLPTWLHVRITENFANVGAPLEFPMQLGW